MKRMQSVALLCAILLMFLTVSCDLDFGVKDFATASFSAFVSKSLNESASTESTTENVNQYYWFYYAGPEAPGDSSQFLAFKDLLDTNESEPHYNKGLGSISDLMRGESYYFALKGYSFARINNSGAGVTVTADESDLKWYGQSSKYKVNSAKMNINLAVAPAGNGNLEFDFTAPAITTNSDWFEIDIKPIDGRTSIKTIHEQGTVCGSVVSYKTANPISLGCGCYLITVKQQTKNGETYSDVVNRGQILVVQVESGVTTIVSGTLDSSTEEAAK